MISPDVVLELHRKNIGLLSMSDGIPPMFLTLKKKKPYINHIYCFHTKNKT